MFEVLRTRSNSATAGVLWKCMMRLVETPRTIVLLQHNASGLKTADLLIDLGLARFFFQAEDGIRDPCVTGVQTCALPISYKVCVAVLAGLEEQPARKQERSARPEVCVGRVEDRPVHRGPIVKRLAQVWAQLQHCIGEVRSEERRVGKECRYRCWQ